jgi:hypothetical protein
MVPHYTHVDAGEEEVARQYKDGDWRECNLSYTKKNKIQWDSSWLSPILENINMLRLRGLSTKSHASAPPPHPIHHQLTVLSFWENVVVHDVE